MAGGYLWRLSLPRKRLNTKDKILIIRPKDEQPAHRKSAAAEVSYTMRNEPAGKNSGFLFYKNKFLDAVPMHC